jgi:ABC-type cobalamin/Fe3+-siderophores transport systems, ATPase components
MQSIIRLKGGVARNELYRFTHSLTMNLEAGEHLAIVGPNAGGKSLLVDTLIGKYPLKEGTLEYDFSPSFTNTAYDNIKYIAFRDTYGAADANYYYQQRWNAHDQDDAPVVKDSLGEVTDTQLRDELFELFAIEPMLDKKLILLSSGVTP